MHEQRGSDRWLDISRMLDELLALPAEQRLAAARLQCAEDAELLAEVVRLLRCADTQHPLPDLTPTAPDRPEPGALHRDEVPRRIGPYELVEIVGSGGMGMVYRAQRVDGKFDQRVAIKLLPRWQVKGQAVDRFRHEQRVLASLSHPHIAQLFDGGVSPEGYPYIVMEFVDGQPINDYCDERGLDVAARVRLVLQVADALHCAHRNLVIHRDVKPSNLLVTADGTVKLVDFGIAKALDARLDSQLTGTQEMPMTPDYAAPEQLFGKPVTVATDVYQLGVLLFQLLTGRRPYRRKPTSIFDLVRMVSDEQPSMPSTAVLRTQGFDPPSGQVREDIQVGALSRAGLARALRGDLDAIILKALDKEPLRRYESMPQFAADLSAALDGHPVTARHQTLAYRGGKWIRRHPWRFASAATIFVLLVSYAITATIQGARIRDALQQARQETRKAEQVAAFLEDIFTSSDPDVAGGKTVTAEQLLHRSRSSIMGGIDEAPEIRAALLSTLGTVHQALGLNHESAELLEESLRLREADPGTARDELADTLTALGNAYLELDRFDDGESVLRRAVALFADDPWSIARGKAVVALGEYHQESGNSDQAEAAYRSAIAGLQTLTGDNRRHAPLALALSNLGTLQLRRSEFDEAEESLRRAVAEQRKATGPNNSLYSLYLSNLSLVVSTLGRFEEAQDLLQQALDVQIPLLGDAHPLVASSYYMLGQTRLLANDAGGARQALERALAIQTRIASETEIGADGLPLHSTEAARTHYRLGLALQALGELDLAGRHLGEALRIDTARLPAHHISIARDNAALASLTYLQGDLERARVQFVQAMEDLASSPVAAAMPRLDYALLLLDLDDAERALAESQAALDALDGLLPNSHPAVIDARAIRAIATLESNPRQAQQARAELQAVWPALASRSPMDRFRQRTETTLAVTAP